MDLVPASEIAHRIERLQTMLAQRGLDGALIFQNVDLFYFSGTMQRGVLYVPVGDDPLLMVIKSLSRAGRESPLKNLVQLKGYSHIFRVLAEHGHHEPARVGLEMDVLPTSRYLWLVQRAKGTEWADISRDLRLIRMIKSAYEVEQFRKGTAILARGYREIAGIIREDMSELEVDGHLALAARRHGHMGIMRMRAFNQEMTYAHVLSGDSGSEVSFCDLPHSGRGCCPAMPQGAGTKLISRDEPIGIDYGVAVNGYVTDQFRTLVLGRLPDALARAHDCAVTILDALEAEAVPGASSAGLFRRAQAIAGDWGLAEHFMGFGEGQVRFVGHGLGLEIDEFPIITPGFDLPLQENMVMALEPKFVFPGQGVVGIEDDYRVGPKGLERLTGLDKAVIKI